MRFYLCGPAVFYLPAPIQWFHGLQWDHFHWKGRGNHTREKILNTNQEVGCSYISKTTLSTSTYKPHLITDTNYIDNKNLPTSRYIYILIQLTLLYIIIITYITSFLQTKIIGYRLVFHTGSNVKQDWGCTSFLFRVSHTGMHADCTPPQMVQRGISSYDRMDIYKQKVCMYIWTPEHYTISISECCKCSKTMSINISTRLVNRMGRCISQYYCSSYMGLIYVGW